MILPVEKVMRHNRNSLNLLRQYVYTRWTESPAETDKETDKDTSRLGRPDKNLTGDSFLQRYCAKNPFEF